MERRTRQRDAIQSALERAARPLAPQEILAAAQDHVPQLGLATVYRAIRALVEAGWLRVVELPGLPSRYEVARRCHHHHFHCRDCDGVFDVDACPGDMERLAPRGFSVEAHEVILYGRCRNCAG